MHGTEEALSVVQRLARRAGRRALEFYGRDVDRESKADRSPVTAADRAANEVILEGLHRAFPGDAVLSEESRDSPARLSASRVWVVDPLDGTREFLARNGEFSIMIGLAIDGAAVLGVVYVPARDLLYAAGEGHGAWQESATGLRRLFCRPAEPARLRLVGSRSHSEPLVAEMREALGIRDAAVSGSVGIKCARIAEGDRDLYVHPAPHLKEWDTCAPEILLREAGGWVSDCLGEPLRYNKPDPRQPHGIVACGPGSERLVLDWLEPRYARSATS